MTGVYAERLPLTPRYRAALGQVAEIARAVGSPNADAEHLFLAILRDRRAVPTQVLAELVDLVQLKAVALDAVNLSASSPSVSSRPQARDEANAGPWGLRDAVAAGSSTVGVEHAFLDLIRDREGTPARTLARFIDPGQAESAIHDLLLGSPQNHGEPRPEDHQRQFLPEGQELDEALIAAIRDSLPVGAAFGFNWEDGRPWVYVGPPGDTRDALNTALVRLGRESPW